MGGRLELTGKIALEVDGRAADAPRLGGLGRRTLVCLALEQRRSVPRDQLAGALWDGEPPATWGAALRGAIARVRRLLADVGLDPAQVLLTEPGGYRLALPESVTVDVEEAAAALVDARRLAVAGDRAEATDRAVAAVRIAAQPLLPEADGAWIDRPRRELAALHLEGLEILSEIARAAGDGQAAAAHAAEVLGLDPYRESAHRLLMQAQAAVGNRAGALRSYEECRRVLAEELGVSPSAATQAVYDALIADEATSPDPPTSSGSPTLRLVTADAGLARELRAGTGPLAGRERELEVLRAAWRAASDGEVRAVLIAGEPGVGKTRLAAEVAAEVVAAGATVLYGRSHQDGVVPYQPFVDAIRHYAVACPPERFAAEVGHGAAELVRLLPELSDRVRAEGPPGRLAAGDRHHVFDAVTVLLGRAATHAPLLLVLDDLHWADTATLLLLRHLLARPDRAPVLVLASYRHTDVQEAPEQRRLLDALAGEANVEHVVLGGLDASSVAAVVATQAGSTPDDRTAAALGRETGGNPFLVETLVRHLTEQGLDASHLPDGSRVVLDELGAPQAVKGLMRERLDGFDEQTAAVLAAAAVVGREVEVAVLATVLELSPEDVLDALDLGIGAGLLTEVDARHQVAFAHDLVRQAVYEVQPRGRRARLHGRVGTCLEDRPGPRTAAVLGELAHHFRSAGTDLAKAAHHAHEAGELATSQCAYEDAATHHRHALEALEVGQAGARSRASELLAMGRAHSSAGASTPAAEAFLLAVEAAREADDPHLLGEAVFGYGELQYEIGGNDPRHVELLEEAIAALRGSDSGLLANLLTQLHEAVYWDEAWVGRTRALADEAVAVARRSGDDRALSFALSCRWAQLWSPADVQERLAITEEMAGYADAAGDERLLLHAWAFRVTDLLILGDHDEADAQMQRHCELADQLRLPRYQWYDRAWASIRALARGDLVEAERCSTEALELGLAVGEPDALQVYGAQLVGIRREQGRMAELRDVVEAMAVEHPAVPAWRATLACIAAETGDLDEAARVLAQVEEVRGDSNWLIAIALLAEAAITLADVPRAEWLYESLAPHDRLVVGAGGAVGPFAAVADLAGGLAAVLGRWDAAIAHHDRALVVTGTRPRSPVHIRAQHRYGTTLVLRGADGDVERARALFDEAHEAATAHGMARLVELTSAALLDAGGAPR